MKGQRWSLGAIVKIPLENNAHGYGQLLSQGSIAALEICTGKELTPEEIVQANVLFIVTIYSNVIPSGRWEKIGKAPVREDLKTLPMKFIQDILNPDSVELYDPNTGEITKATKADCVGLEKASVWGAEHVESRIADHFAGRDNKWVQQLKLK